jgi:hypothetical protein
VVENEHQLKIDGQHNIRQYLQSIIHIRTNLFLHRRPANFAHQTVLVKRRTTINEHVPLTQRRDEILAIQLQQIAPGSTCDENEQKLEPQDNLPSFTTDGSSSLTRALLKHRELAEIITGVECFYNSLDRTMRYEMKLCCKHQKQSSTKLTVSLMYASKQPRSTMNICVPTSPMWITVSPGAHWSG